MVHTKNDTILKMIKGEKTSHTPVWFMRQAGGHNQNTVN